MRAHTSALASDIPGMEVGLLAVTDTHEHNAAEVIVRELSEILSYCTLNNPDDMGKVVSNLREVREFAQNQIFLMREV